MSYCYDQAGSLTAYTNGLDSATFGAQSFATSQQFDAAGRLSTITSSWNDVLHPANLFTASGYTAAGALQNWMLGPEIVASKSYDNRLRPLSETASHP